MEESPAGWDLFSPSGSPQAEQQAGRAARSAQRRLSPGRPGQTGWPQPAPGRAVPVWLPLLAVLVVQTLLSVRLLWADTAFQDEATYLWAGHLEWAGLLHGSSVPPFPTYFSGAPVIYPPLGALADSAGGLTGARLLSLAFMLGSTLLLWDLTRRLFGARAAFFAAALFALLGPTLHLGAFATYDAMSMFLLALATWCAAGAGAAGEATSRMALGGVALALANATAYSTALFDPVVIVVAVLVAWPAGRRVAVRRCATLLTVTVALLVAGLLLGGRSYLTGITETTVERAAGSDPVLSVLGNAWSWTGVVLVLAWCGVFSSWAARHGRRQTWLLAVLAVGRAARPAGAGQPAHLRVAEQAHRPGRLVCRDRRGLRCRRVHRDRAGWPLPAADHRRVRTRAGFPRLFQLHPVLDVRHRVAQLGQLRGDLPAARRARQPARRDARPGPLLPPVRQPVAALVVHPQHRPAQRGQHRRACPAGVVAGGDPAVFARYISQGYFSVVALNFADTTALDRQIRADLAHSHYHIVEVVPYNPPGTSGTNVTGTYVIWRYKAPPQ